MEEKKESKISKKKIIAIIISIILIFMIVITFSVIRSKKKTNSELGNISNMGLAAIGNEGVFYNKFEDGIIKVKNGKESQITNETAYSITLVEDDIYYLTINESNNITIKKVKTNGSGMATIKSINTSISKIYIDSTSIYYATNSNTPGIAKMELDGSNERTILAGEIQDFEVVEGKIYYTTKLGDLYVATTNGTDVAKITPKDTAIKEIQVSGDWIYYFKEDEKHSYRLRNDGTENKLFSQYVNSNIFNLAKDNIYFFDIENKKIASINYNGEKYKEIVAVSTNKTKINVVDDTIYYLDASNNESKIYQMYRVKTNGGNAPKIEY